jgi:Xaa-Pro aminopeptidase
MSERGWDVLLFYGDGWRKDLFRCLINVNFSGRQAVAVLSRTGEVRALVTDAWDLEQVAAAIDGKVSLTVRLAEGLRTLLSRERRAAVVAVNGLEQMEARFVHAVREASGAPVVSATSDIDEIRRVKTTQEIAWIRQAAELADRGYEHFVRVCEPGMTEFELVAEVESFVKAKGAEDNFMLVASGGTEVTGMKPPTARRFQPGDSVTTELTPQINGYYAQICRTLVIGEPSAAQLEAHSIFSSAQQAAVELLRPGVDICDVARVQNDVFRKHGYGDYTGPQYTRVRGHNLGLYPDELPHVLENVHYICRKDMVLIAHPNTYLPLSGYMVFGDTLLVTADGCVSLSRTERKLFQAGRASPGHAGPGLTSPGHAGPGDASAGHVTPGCARP